MTYYSEHSRFLLSVDVIVFGFEERHLKVLIGRRQMDPGRGEWSLYGGFVRQDESIDDAASRTLYELTGMHNVYMRQVGAFGSVDRDPGERVISVAYYALINVNDYDAHKQQEYNVDWVSLDSLPRLFSDHNDMVALALKRMRQKIKTDPAGIRLLPQLFTLTQLQRLYEALLGEEMDKRNFRRRIKEMDFIEKTPLVDSTHRGPVAALYRFNRKAYNEDPNFKL